MIPPGGGAHFDHRHPALPPPPPPPPPPPAQPNQTSFSTLSPLARPFTLDYVLPSQSPPPSHHSPNPILASDRPSASRLPPVTAPSGALLSQHRSGTLDNSYYAGYYSDPQSQAFDDSLCSSSAFSGGGRSPWSRPFDGEVGRGKRTDAISTWAELSLSYKAPPFPEELAADHHSYYDNDAYGFWHGKFSDPLIAKVDFGSQSSHWIQDKHSNKYEQDMQSSYSIFSAPFSTPSSLLDGKQCPGTKSLTSGIQSRESFSSNPTYDRYMAQLDLCSVNPLAFCPSATSSTSSRVYEHPSSRSSSNTKATSSSVTVHELPYKSNDSLTIPSSSIEISFNHLGKSKGGYNEKKREDTYKIKSTLTLLPAHFGKDIPSSIPAVESPSNLSVINPELSVNKVVAADSSPSRCNSVEPDKSFKSSSEALDLNNLAVDSPCWKGAPAPRQSPFRVDEVLAAETSIEESDCSNNPCQDWKNFLDCVGNSQNSAEQVESLISDGNKRSFVSDKPQCPSAPLSGIQQNPESPNKQSSDLRKDAKAENLCDVMHGEQLHQTVQIEKKDSESQGFDGPFLAETECVTVNKSSLAKGTNDDNTGSTSATQRSIKEFVKAIHSSSIGLLSTNFGNNYELEAHDFRLLYSAINNISLVLNDKKDFVGSGHYGLEAAWSCCRCSNPENVSQSNLKGKMCSVGCNNNNVESDNVVPKGSDADLKKVNSMTQTFGNTLSETFSVRGQNAQTLLYKNLWIEAEIEICKLKYELQLAKLKTGSENSRPSGVIASQPFQHDLEGDNSLSKAKGGSLSPPRFFSGRIPRFENKQDSSVSHELKEPEDVESSNMARAKILKDRIASSDDRNMHGQETVDPKVPGLCPDGEGNVHGSLDAENNSGANDLPTDLAELGFMENVAQPYARYSAHVEDDLSPYSSPYSNISGYANATPMFSGSLNGALIQSYMTGSWQHSSGTENPSTSFDWEYVQWQDS